MNRNIHIVRESIGRIVGLLTRQKITVTQQGQSAYVKYHPTTGAILSVNIPYLPDTASDEFVAAVQGFLDHEVGHVLFSDPKALAQAKAAGARVMNLANLIEDVFVEKKMSQAFAGSGHNLDTTRRFFFDKLIAPKVDAAMASGDLKEARGYAAMAAVRSWGGQRVATDFIKDHGLQPLVDALKEKLGDELIAKIAQCKSSFDCLDLAKIFKEKLEEPSPPPPAPPAPPEEDDDEPGESDDSSDDSDASKPSKGEESGETEVPPSGSIPDDPEGEDRGETDDPGSAGEDSAPEAPTDKRKETDDREEGEPEDREPEEDESRPGEGADDDEEGDGADKSGEGESGLGDEEDPDGEESEGSGSDDDDDQDDGESGESSGEAGEGAEDDDDGDRSERSGKHTDDSTESPDDMGSMFDTEHDFDKEMSEGLTKHSSAELSSAPYRIFSTDWDRVEEAPISPRGRAAAAKMIEKTAGMVGVMQKSLERAFAAENKRAWNSGLRKGRIAPGALYRSSVGDDRLFRQRVETRARNTAVSFLVDCSGSMSGSKIETAADCAYAFSSTLERLRIKHEVIGFTTKPGREMEAAMEAERVLLGSSGIDRWAREEPLYMPVFKGFNERLNPEVEARMASMYHGAFQLRENVDGECVQIAAHRLLSQRAERHVLIVASDGNPACPGDYRMLNSHLKKTVKELEKSGKVEVFAIGIMSNAVDSYYSKRSVIYSLDEVPTKLMQELTRILLA